MLHTRRAATAFLLALWGAPLFAEPYSPGDINYDPAVARMGAPVMPPPSAFGQVDHVGDLAREEKLQAHNNVIPCSYEEGCHVGADGFWHVDFDFTILTAHFSSPAFGIQGSATALGPRLQFGKERDNGFGWAARFWGISNDADIVDSGGDPTGATIDVSASRIDLDFYRRFRFEDASVLFGAGLAIASLETELSDPNGIDSGRDSGTGVNIFSEGRHLFYETEKTEWSLIGRGRWAYLAGDWESTLQPGVDGTSNIDIAEAAFGTEFVRRFRRSSLLVQCLMEAQSWDTTYNRHVNYLGTSVRVGYYW